MNREIYLDNNATTRPLPQVRDAMLCALGDTFGNPSSSTSAGQRSRAIIRDAREHVSDLVNAKPEAVTFVSSGTEANNLVLHSAATGVNQPHIVTSTVEHSSILQMCEHLERLGARVTYLPVSKDGLIDLPSLASAITSATSLVSIQWVNNETGVIQPIEKIAACCHTHGVPFHTDAAQAVGKLPIDFAQGNVDYLTLTAHKLHGPQGIGAIISRNPKLLRPMLFGGDQESGRRAGTENVAGICGFGAAAKTRAKRMDDVNAHVVSLRDRFENAVLANVGNASVNGSAKYRVGNTTNLLFKGIDGEALVARLDQMEVICSQSSACTNQRPEPSYVLRAMGLSEADAYASIRVAFSEENTVNEVDWASEMVAILCERLLRFQTKHISVSHLIKEAV